MRPTPLAAALALALALTTLSTDALASKFSIGCDGSAGPAFSEPPVSLTAMAKPGLAGFSGVKIALAPILSARRARQHARTAPRILLSSKEFIEFGLPERARNGTGWVATEVSVTADRYRFACALATRISATITANTSAWQFDIRHVPPDGPGIA